MNDDVIEILIAGKARIEHEGWRQGSISPAGDDTARDWGEPRLLKPGRCALDAVVDEEAKARAGFEWTPVFDAQELLGQALTGGAGKPMAVMGWNDKPGRTVEEVYALYDTAIGLARAAQAGAP